MKSKSILVVVVLSFYLVSRSFATTASFQGLGDLPGGIFESRAYDVSSDGAVVVGNSQSASGQKAFRWENGVITNLGYLSGDSSNSSANAVSENGSVVVGYNGSASGIEAFRWENGVMTGLGDLPDGGFTSYGNDVSADGSIVVGRATSTEGMEAFRWENNIMVGLGCLSGPFSSRAYGVSADGSVVVGQSVNQAFRWTTSDGMQALNNLPNVGDRGNALAISADGLVIVGWAGDASDIYGDKEAFRWEDGVAIGLGDLPGGLFYSWANDVSADGSVVVGWSTRAPVLLQGTEEAFIWDGDNGMRSIKDTLVNDCGLDLTGWTLYNATGVSYDGFTIVGEGINPNGFHEGWIATIPEPSMLLLLGFGAMVLRRKGG